MMMEFPDEADTLRLGLDDEPISDIRGQWYREFICSYFGHIWKDGHIPDHLMLSKHYRYWICDRCGHETESDPRKSGIKVTIIGDFNR